RRRRQTQDANKLFDERCLVYGLQEMVRTEIQADPLIGKSMPKFNMILRKNAVMHNRVKVCEEHVNKRFEERKAKSQGSRSAENPPVKDQKSSSSKNCDG